MAVSPESPANLPLATRLPILEYHDTEYKGGSAVQMTAAWFLDQLKWLSDNGFKTLNSAELIQFVEGAARPPQKSVVLRFDLGMPIEASVRTVIIPALQKYGFRALFFVLTSAIKENNANNYLAWGQLREWEQAGLIEVASHGINHPDYQKADTNTRVWDARESKRLIESKLGHPIFFFAYPFDSVPAAPENFLKPFGYRLAFAGYSRLERSVLFKDPKPYTLPAYYPYSNPSSYPRLTTANNQTFDQLILGAIKNPGESVPPVTTTPGGTPGSGSSIPSDPPNTTPPVSSPQHYRITTLKTGVTTPYTLNSAFKPLVTLPVPYISQLGPGAETHSNDCGAAAALMLLRAYTNLELLPDDFYRSFGIPGDTMLTETQIRAVLLERGIPTERYQNLTIQNLFAFLAASRPVIVLLRYQVFAQAGLTEKTLAGPHYSVVVGLDTRNVYLHDPLYSRPSEGEAHPYPLDLFWRAWKETANDPQFPNPACLAIVPTPGLGFRLVRKVRATSGVNVRSGPGLSFQVINTLAKNAVVEIIRDLNGWGEIPGLGWVALSYTLPA